MIKDRYQEHAPSESMSRETGDGKREELNFSGRVLIELISRISCGTM